MINKYKQYRFQLLLPFVIILLGSVFFFTYPKGEVVLLLNKLHNPTFNFIFRKLSSIGNALSVFFFLLIVVRFKFKYLYFFILAFAIESFIIIICKHLIFDGTFRPYLFFKELGLLDAIDFVQGVKIRKTDSFPSGHTAYSFFIATFFVLKLNNLKSSVVIFLLATLIGVSRMYLVQHFFADVFTGAVVGVLATYTAFILVFKTQKSWYNYRLTINTNKESLVVLTNE
ncbi:membrane-associated phospholipid phosphatase [Wenyingzhuangia heitensis]|uniref:Membrane-associated phospholipid phosphatase n=1 Tax=Wenyingzhuangia heitensis TaxID=1487859 RepID=A0ABX0UDP8_9FLAO|nr:phosphatase PAP2 family protein [Wenyingzhuangia heitensis]NIJ46010.1 membrane-associated phospholipid phosphatase [Wenyingzhuangia heitensis]